MLVVFQNHHGAAVSHEICNRAHIHVGGNGLCGKSVAQVVGPNMPGDASGLEHACPRRSNRAYLPSIVVDYEFYTVLGVFS